MDSTITVSVNNITSETIVTFTTPTTTVYEIRVFMEHAPTSVKTLNASVTPITKENNVMNRSTRAF